MSERELAQYLQDILEAIHDLEHFIEKISFEDFLSNLEKQRAVVKQIEIIGEAIKYVPDEVRVKYPQIPWRQFAGMRDRLVHRYWSLDLEIVWDTVQVDVPLLEAVIVEIKENFN